MTKKILSIALCIIMIFSLFGCSNSNNSAFNFNTKLYVEERNDGWVYISDYSYAGDEQFYSYDAYNLKYQHIEGYDLNIYDEDTGELVGKATTVMPYLSLLPQAEKDIRAITAFYKDAKIANTITESDLKNLSLELVDKSDVIHMFNKTIAQDPESDGKYSTIPAINLIQSALLDGYKWQAAYLVCHGNIVSFRIELIYDNEIYLSDLIEKGETNSEQLKIYNEYKSIEKSVTDSGSFIIDNHDSTLKIGNVQFSTLYELLNRLESGDK